MGETEQNHQLKPQEEKSERWFGFGKQRLLKVFFGGNAVIAVVVLLLITFFLFREGLSFFPQYREDLERYRRSGMEFATMVKEEHERFNELFRSLVDIRKEQIDQLTAAGLSHEEIREATAPLQALVYDFSDLAIPLRDYQLDVRNIAQGTYQLSLTSHEEETVLAKRYASTISSLRETFPAYAEINLKLADGIEAQMEKLPGFESPALQNKVETFRENAIRFIDMLPVYQAKLIAWQPTKHVGLGEAISSFLFGREWIINNDGHSDYGLLPLLTGSLLVTGIAIILAIPLGVGAAIYTNQMAARGEASVIKPFIEFITAIPSVVIGFFGIAVLGSAIRWLSQQSALDWLPFFPIAERLNAFTAGCLLALMAVPTIFTLSEEALNRVPLIYKESSLALGANRFQTTMRIIVPTALSGIISAVLLGIGRVIGETMVVLLCAGNRIQIPQLSEGMGVVFEPVHTMTGIIAQEMGEVAQGSMHYRALFCVGIVLFVLTLVINLIAQKLFHHYRVGE